LGHLARHRKGKATKNKTITKKREGFFLEWMEQGSRTNKQWAVKWKPHEWSRQTRNCRGSAPKLVQVDYILGNIELVVGKRGEAKGRKDISPTTNEDQSGSFERFGGDHPLGQTNNYYEETDTRERKGN